MTMVIVSRHRAAIRFIAEEIVKQIKDKYPCAQVSSIQPTFVDIFIGWGHPTTGLVNMCQDGFETPILLKIPVMTEAKIDDIRGKQVWGNIPLHLASAAASVFAMEFKGAPPRGQEFSLEDMQAAGAHINRYIVRQVDSGAEMHFLATEELRAGGYCI